MRKKKCDILLQLATKNIEHVILQILEALDWPDLSNCLLVSKAWNQMIKSFDLSLECRQRAHNLLSGEGGVMEAFVRGISPPPEHGDATRIEVLDEVQ